MQRVSTRGGYKVGTWLFFFLKESLPRRPHAVILRAVVAPFSVPNIVFLLEVFIHAEPEFQWETLNTETLCTLEYKRVFFSPQSGEHFNSSQAGLRSALSLSAGTSGKHTKKHRIVIVTFMAVSAEECVCLWSIGRFNYADFFWFFF